MPPADSRLLYDAMYPFVRDCFLEVIKRNGGCRPLGPRVLGGTRRAKDSPWHTFLALAFPKEELRDADERLRGLCNADRAAFAAEVFGGIKGLRGGPRVLERMRSRQLAYLGIDVQLPIRW